MTNLDTLCTDQDVHIIIRSGVAHSLGKDPDPIKWILVDTIGLKIRLDVGSPNLADRVVNPPVLFHGVVYIINCILLHSVNIPAQSVRVVFGPEDLIWVLSRGVITNT